MTTYTAPRAAAHDATEHHRPPARAFGKLVAVQARTAWREPLMPLISLSVPIFYLAVVGLAFNDSRDSGEFTGDARFTIAAYMMPVFVGMAVGMIALFCLPEPFVRDRESRWLRRVSTTPAPPSWLLGAHTVVNAGLALLAVAVLVFGGFVLLDVAPPAAPGGYALAVLLLITAMFALGLLITAVAPTTGFVQGLGWGLYLPLLLLGGGIGLQRADMGNVLGAISDATPLMAAARAMRDATLGSFPSASSLLVLVGWTVVCGLLAVRFFRWE